MRNSDTPATNTHFSVVATLAIRIQFVLKVAALLFMTVMTGPVPVFMVGFYINRALTIRKESATRRARNRPNSGVGFARASKYVHAGVVSDSGRSGLAPFYANKFERGHSQLCDYVACLQRKEAGL